MTVSNDLTPEQRAERLERAKDEALANERVDAFIQKRNEAAAARTNPFRRQPNESEKL